jgi:CspA family cold shock protein
LAGQLGRSAPSLTGRTYQPLTKSKKPGTAQLFAAAALTCIPTAKGHSMTPGTVKFYNNQKGFGFIQPDDGQKDVYVHATALERAGIHALREGQKVKFDMQNDPRSGKVAVGTIELA